MHLVNIHFLAGWHNSSLLDIAHGHMDKDTIFNILDLLQNLCDIFLIDVPQLWAIAASSHHAKGHAIVNVHATAAKYSGMFSSSQRD